MSTEIVIKPDGSIVRRTTEKLPGEIVLTAEDMDTIHSALEDAEANCVSNNDLRQEFARLAEYFKL